MKRSLCHQNLEEHGSFRDIIENTGWPLKAQTPNLEEGVLQSVDQTLGTNVRALALHPDDIDQLSIVQQEEALHQLQSCIESAGITARYIIHDLSHLHRGL